VLIRLAFQIATATVPLAEKKEIDWIPIFGVVGTVATVFFGLLSLYFYLKSRRNKLIVFTYDKALVQTRDHPDVTIVFRGEQIENLCRAQVVCWNGGTEEVRWIDIPPGSPPSLSLGGNKRILSVASRESCSEIEGGVVQRADDGIAFRFAYLNPGDRIVAEILYEVVDVTSVALPVSIEAPLIGGQSVLRHYRMEQDAAAEFRSRTLKRMILFMVLGLVVLVIMAIVDKVGGIHIKGSLVSVGWNVFCGSVLLWGIGTFYWSFRRSRGPRLPGFAESMLGDS